MTEPLSESTLAGDRSSLTKSLAKVNDVYPPAPQKQRRVPDRGANVGMPELQCHSSLNSVGWVGPLDAYK